MGDENRRKVTPFAKIAKQIENHVPGALVQVSGGLVGKQQRRVGSK
jgi:hypothetical protein